MKKIIFYFLTICFCSTYAQNLTFDTINSNVGADKSIIFNINSSLESDYRIISKDEHNTNHPLRVGGKLLFQSKQYGFWHNTLSISRLLVGIGTSNPDEKLTVNGTIHAKEIKVDLNIPADYVFEKYFTGYSNLKPDYRFLSLEEIEAYIKANNHLPEVPSAQEITENGLYLKEMTNLLLQKIEELTLYTIEQEKKINLLLEEVEELKESNNK